MNGEEKYLRFFFKLKTDINENGFAIILASDKKEITT